VEKNTKLEEGKNKAKDMFRSTGLIHTTKVDKHGNWNLDGVRYDYLTKAATPNIDRLIESGVYVPRLRPTFPTKTFPNYYALATGLFAESHGIVGNCK